jgi:holliday junction DNA helicase RuvA
LIGRLSGVVALKADGQVMLDVRGVGYVVHVSDRTQAALPAAGEAASLWTELLVREDLLQLFGFLTLQEREWHRLLLSVQGVGAKAALAILGTLGPEGLGRAVALGDWTSVKAAPGIGPKIAQRVVLELKGKAPGVMALGAARPADSAVEFAPVEAGTVAQPPSASPQGGAAATAEALSALVNLGYAPGEAAAAVASAAGGGADGAPP